MAHPYKTREGGATVTVFVPYDCQNNCPFCINKKEYVDCSGFSLEKILASIQVMDGITPRCDFVFTGGEPLADLNALQQMLDAIPATHKIYIHLSRPGPHLLRGNAGLYGEEQRQDHLHEHLPPPTALCGRKP